MKVKSSVVPIVLTVAAVAAVLILSSWLNTQLVPADIRLSEQINAEVKKAQSMLVAYDPSASRMLTLLQIPSDPGAAATAPNGRDASDAESALPAPPEQDEHKGRLQRNEQLLKDALAMVTNAVQMGPVQVGDETYSGSMHPAATRLQTVLIYSLADLKRREAANYQAKAVENRDRFYRVYDNWMNVQARLRSTARGLTTDLSALPDAAVAKSKASRSSKGGAIKKMLSRLLSPGAGGQPASEPPDDTVLTTETTTVPESIEVEVSAIVDEQLPTIDQRIAQMRVQREERTATIAEARQNVEQLTETTAQLQRKIDALNTEARQAEQRMMALREAGIDPTDEQSLKNFVEQYEAAAKTARRAWREAEVLQKGSILNARPDTNEEEEWLSAPLVAADPSQAMEPVRGLVAYEGDLRAERALLETNQALLAQIDNQIAELTQTKQATEEMVAKLTNTNRRLKEEALRHARRTVELMAMAAQLEHDAATLVEEQGIRAAQNASRAMSKQQNDTRDFIATKENKPNHPNAKELNTLANDRSQVGYADVLKGDMEYCLAVIRAQTADGCRAQAPLLERATVMGIAGKPDLLPSSAEAGSNSEAESIPAWVYDADAARNTAKEQSDKALESARNALDFYQNADETLNQIWVLHTNIAAVRQLLARLSPDPAQQQEHRRLALEKYTLAIQDRRDRPEAPLYVRIIDYLKANP